MAARRIDSSLRFDSQADLPSDRIITRLNVEGPTGQIDIQTRREPYLAAPDLEEAVNVAIALGRPLLLQGDPGSGKTRLAHAVAYALELPLEEVYIKSTTRAQDLLYTYDAVRRLYDAQLPVERRPDRQVADLARYITLGPLGRAIVRAEQGQRSVVLIDEIDKADIDFPNDLLRELDQLAFDVMDQPGRHHAVPDGRHDLRPIIFVTNNEEKLLPTAFLRRCIFHYLEFPRTPEGLKQILDLHEMTDVQLQEAAIDVILRLRQLDLTRRPGLSELLDWVRYLDDVQVRPEELEGLPYSGALIKDRTDQTRAMRLLSSTTREPPPPSLAGGDGGGRG